MSRVDSERFRDGHYVGLPASYDDLFVQRRAYLVRQIPGFTGNTLTLADVGCGNGNTLFLFTSDFQKCYGIDLFEENRKFFNRVAEEKKIQNAEFILTDIEHSSIDLHFDRIVCFEVIEHFKNEDSVRNLFELLNPGGKIAITVPHKWWLFETHGARLPLLPWNRVPFFSWLPKPLHERWSNARIYTRKRIVKLFEKQGFIVKESMLMNAPLDVLGNSSLKRFLLKTVFRGIITRCPLLATNVFLWAEKPV